MPFHAFVRINEYNTRIILKNIKERGKAMAEKNLNHANENMKEVNEKVLGGITGGTKSPMVVLDKKDIGSSAQSIPVPKDIKVDR